MSTSSKDSRTIRQGGPGASHENADDPKDPKKPGGDVEDRPQRSRTSGGGGEADSHHTADPKLK